MVRQAHHDVQELLQKIASSPTLEARWLNTLSLLEFVGARKISKTVCQHHPSLEVLAHFADETRHAFTFKNLSQQLSGSDCRDYLCREEALGYFQTLDRDLSRWITNLTAKDEPYQNYLAVTCAIERRAMKLYPLYRSITGDPRVREELGRVIEEEASHKGAIEEALGTLLKEQGASYDSCLKKEDELFENLVATLTHHISSEKPL